VQRLSQLDKEIERKLSIPKPSAASGLVNRKHEAAQYLLKGREWSVEDHVQVDNTRSDAVRKSYLPMTRKTPFATGKASTPVSIIATLGRMSNTKQDLAAERLPRANATGIIFFSAAPQRMQKKGVVLEDQTSISALPEQFFTENHLLGNFNVDSKHPHPAPVAKSSWPAPSLAAVTRVGNENSIVCCCKREKDWEEGWVGGCYD
jgi:hypothetical protein